MGRTYLGELRKYLRLQVWDFLPRVNAARWNLRSEHTGTASITKSTSDRSSIEVLEVSLPLAASASSLDILCLLTSFSRSLSANFSPLSMDACELSINLTGTEAFCAATKAIPRPCIYQLTIHIDVSSLEYKPSVQLQLRLASSLLQQLLQKV